jgi:NarL family two-component system response regulator LiaR
VTAREADVLRLVARGYSDRQIADALFVSPRTVNAHVRNMLAKADVANRTELSVWAVEQGIVTR